MQSRNEVNNNVSLEDLIKEMYTDILPFIDGSDDELREALKLALGNDVYKLFRGNVTLFLRYLSPLLDTAKKLGDKPKLPEDASMRLIFIGEKFKSLFDLMLSMLQKDPEHKMEAKIRDFLSARGVSDEKSEENFTAVVNTWGHVLTLEATKEFVSRTRVPK